MEKADAFHPRHPGVTTQAVLAECKRELAQRRTFYPRRVEQARMTQEEADAQLALAAAWHEDVSRIIAFEEAAAAAWKTFLENPAVPRITELSDPGHGLSWQQRRTGLARELDLRRRIYPRRIEQAQMTKCIATRQLAALEALADRYDDGFDWRASNGVRPQFGRIATGPEILQARREWDEHRERVDTRRTPAQQQELLMN